MWPASESRASECATKPPASSPTRMTAARASAAPSRLPAAPPWECCVALHLAEEVSDKVELYRCTTISDPAKRMGELLVSAAKEIEQMLVNLEGFKDLESHRIEVHRLENEGDQTTREALAHLFVDDGMSAPELIKWKDIYDLLEDTLDGCEHVANVLERITIKNA